MGFPQQPSHARVFEFNCSPTETQSAEGVLNQALIKLYGNVTVIEEEIAGVYFKFIKTVCNNKSMRTLIGEFDSNNNKGRVYIYNHQLLES